MLKFRDLFVKHNNHYSEIQPTWRDIRNNIILPKDMTEDLSEETGIHIGDGNLSYYMDKRNHVKNRYRIDGNLTDEFIYHTKYISPLIKKLFNYNSSFVTNDERNSIQTNIRSKMIIEFKTRVLGLPIGNKKNILIPKQIIKQESFSKRCLAGIFDTDFSLTKTMGLTGRMTSLNLMKQISNLLITFRIPHTKRFKNNYCDIFIRKDNAVNIIENWGLHNNKHVSKYRLYKEFNTYLPFTHTEERLAVLDGNLDIDDLRLISNTRKKSIA